MITDCISRKRRWTEITTDGLAAEDGIKDLGQWLLDVLSTMTDDRMTNNVEENCLHLQTISVSQEDYDALEVESLLDENGSDSTH
jgi:hypothetical protein